VAAQPDVTVSIDAPAQAAAGSDFTANVNISTVTNFDACNYDVSFNASVLRLDNVTSGLIGSTPVPVDIANEISSGTWTIVQNVSGTAGVSGSGYLAVLHFHVIGSAGSSSNINLSNGVLSNNLAQEIPATWVGDTVSVPDTTPPTVASTSPVANATGVAISTAVSATFSEAMNASTITTTSFTLKAGTTPVSGSVSYNSGTYTATFTPGANLSYSTTYTATLSTAITDATGNPLASAYSWSFTTASAPPGMVTVSISAPDTAAPGSDFTANVNISTVTNFDACNYDVSFNASVLRLDNVTSGLIGSTPVPVDIYNEISSGTWTIVQNVSGTAGVTGSGYLAVLHFHVIGSNGTSSAISLSNGVLSNNLAEEIPATWVGDSVSVVGVDTTPPTVASVSPASGATGVAVNTVVTATFSEALNASTITTSSFTLKVGTTSVSGSVSYNSGTYTATFTPSANLSYSTTYTATLSTAIKDVAGNPLASAYSWSFTTASASAPTVTSVSPASGATGVAITTAVTATFNMAMTASTITTTSFTLKAGTTPVSGSVSYNSSTYTATFTPGANLSYSTTYTATLSTAITNTYGTPLASAYSWSFTTASAPDTTPPTVASTSPVANATGVAISTTVSATFSEALNALTITTTSFTLKAGATSVSGSISYNSSTYTATFTPGANLTISTTYTATLSTAITDAAGNPLASAYSWSFTTVTGDLGDEVDATPPGGTLVLGAGTYAGNVIIDKPITITGTAGTIISGGITIGELTGSSVTIENLTITGYTDFGIKIVKVKPVDTFIIRNNTIQGVSGSIIGIEVDEVVFGGSLTIERNSILGNQVGIKLLEHVADATIQFNNITNNTTGLEILAVVSDADASYNWWSDISGPKETNNNPGGIGNKVVGDIDYQPWLTRQFQTVLDDNIAYFGFAMVEVDAGWNIISTPIALDPACDTWGEYAALGDGLNLHATSPAYYFDSQTQAWVTLTNAYPLKPCDAIYVRMASADVAPILYSPNLSVPSKQLYTGWNLVGLAYVDSLGLKANEALVSIEEVAGGLTGYKLVVSPPVNQPSWIYTGGAIADWNGQGQPPAGWMLRTYGYWVFMLNNGTLAGFTFTPVSLGR
jgi:hypothetical protein